MVVGVETPGICGISALNRSLGGWLGCSDMRYSPDGGRIVRAFNAQCGGTSDIWALVLSYEQSSWHERPFNRNCKLARQGEQPATSCSIFRWYVWGRTAWSLLVKWLQNAARGLSGALGHPTVVIEKYRPISHRSVSVRVLQVQTSFNQGLEVNRTRELNER